ncbi:MAG: glycosyltransferase [Gemmatimonadaceae bacterium]|nr:glycosyltransferase [Gemmatimonadaceae bacterium]
MLYLVPQPKRADRIGAYSFLDEEIQALAAAGVEAFVLSRKVPEDTWCGRVRLKAARKPSDVRLGVASFLVRRAKDVPIRYFLELPALHHVGRLEYEAAAIVKAEGIDLIHSHFAWPAGFGGILARAETGRPLVATLRGTDVLLDEAIDYGRRTSKAYDRALRRLLATADRTVYFSNYMRDRALELGARPAAARVVRKGVDLAHFAVADDRVGLRRTLGLGERPMILTVAGLIPRKGVHHILEALAIVARDRDFSFVVCGEGPERARLETLSAELGLADRTVFAGRVTRADIPKYFAASDVFVLASLVEAAGNVLFEAMASGRPIVCTDSGGPPEYVKNAETGFVVPVGQPEAMAARIGQLLNDPALQDRLGAEGRRQTMGEFDYDRMVRDIRGVYRETLAASAPRQAAAS